MRDASYTAGLRPSLLVLATPHDRPAPATPALPDLGAILVADLATGIPALAHALLARRVSPWCPVCIVDPDQSVTATELAAFEPFPGCFAILAPDVEPQSTEIVAAVQRRDVPTPRVLSHFVVQRTGARKLMEDLDECFGRRLESAPESDTRPLRTLSRRVNGFGPLTVRDWSGVAALIAAVAPGPRPIDVSLDRFALERGLDPRTFRRWLRLCTDLDWEAAAQLSGWEWLLESALRKWEYVAIGGGARPAARAEAG